MTWYQYCSIGAWLVCFASLSFHLVRLIRLGGPRDFSRPGGDTGEAIRYSFTGAMNPMKKESAYLHLPTYTAGLLYHFGTFLSSALFILSFVSLSPEGWMRWIAVALLGISGTSGTGIFVKRAAQKKLRALSHPDDFLSNFLVTIFQFLTMGMLVTASFAPFYYISASLLWLYLPLGKLKHALYFFAARYHLGIFYGWRGVWPLRIH